MIEEKWEENKEECQRIAQEFIYDEKRKSECVKYLIDHFKWPLMRLQNYEIWSAQD